MSHDHAASQHALCWHDIALLASNIGKDPLDLLPGRPFADYCHWLAGFYGYGGEGFSLLLPSQWNPSKERDVDGVVLRYEDNGDSVNHVLVLTRKSDKSSIEGYGSPDDFLSSISNLLGQQVFTGELDHWGW